MRPAALLLVAIVLGTLVGICLAGELRAEPRLRFVTVRSGDWVKVKGQHLECNVAPDSFYCIETGGAPRLSFIATTTGGAGKGEFIIGRWPWLGQVEQVAQFPRRK